MSAADTKVCSKCSVEKALTGFHKNKTARDGLQQWCIDCHRVSRQRWRDKNRDRTREYHKQWYEHNKDLVREISKQRYVENRDLILERNRRWESNNKAKRLEYTATRHAAKMQRTPVWADRDAIKAVYAEAQMANEIFGVEHHVDHIYPLQGRTVSGLHVAENLRVVTAEENIQKHNLTPEDLKLREILT